MYVFLIIIGAILFITICFFRTPTGKGIWGEFKVKLVLGKNKENSKYVINNLMITYEGKSSQIDHILINQNGIFVIETKNYSGTIFGTETQKQWIQVLNYGKVKNRFYNPILQNKTHIYYLSKLMKRSDCFESIIVFPKARLRTETTSNVGYIRIIKRVIKSKKNIVLSINEMNTIYNLLMDYKKNPRISNREHISNINQMKSTIDSNHCPRCGKELVIRTGKYGQFYGCSGYPDCKFIKKQ